MNTTTEQLVALMQLEKIEENIYRGQSENFVGKRVFGGQVLGQALRAAALTCENRLAHSMHAYFLLGGNIEAPIIYQVKRLRDGKSFSSRFVEGIQFGEVIFSAMISFSETEAGLEYQMAEPDYAEAETLPNEEQLKQRYIDYVPETLKKMFLRQRPVEIRPVQDIDPLGSQPQAPFWANYIKTYDPLADDPALHQAIIAFCSDYGLLATSLLPHGLHTYSPNLQCASLDHSLYFHRPVFADQWTLYDMSSNISHASRGLNTCQMWQNGKLVATAMQEGLIRMREFDR